MIASCASARKLELARLLRAAELLFGDDPLDIVGLASDAVAQASIRLDRHAADDRVDARPALFGAALRSLTLVMNVFVYREGVRHGISDHRPFSHRGAGWQCLRGTLRFHPEQMASVLW